MDAPLGDGLADVRDRTLFLLGFAGSGALRRRRSELVALDVEDVSEDDGGLRLILRKSKVNPRPTKKPKARCAASPTAVNGGRCVAAALDPYPFQGGPVLGGAAVGGGPVGLGPGLRGAGFGGLLLPGQHLGPGLALGVMGGLLGGVGAGLLNLRACPRLALGQAR